MQRHQHSAGGLALVVAETSTGRTSAQPDAVERLLGLDDDLRGWYLVMTVTQRHVALWDFGLSQRMTPDGPVLSFTNESIDRSSTSS